MRNSPAGDSQPTNPSAWPRRAALVGLALVGFAVASYLSLFQWKVIPAVWDPLFGNGSREILTSSISRSLPIPDATLGAAAYAVDGILAMLGGGERWRASPWAALLNGFVALGLVVTGIFLVGAQLFVFHTGCTLCLVSATVSFTTGALIWDEVRASAERVRRERADGRPIWAALRGQ